MQNAVLEIFNHLLFDRNEFLHSPVSPLPPLSLLNGPRVFLRDARAAGDARGVDGGGLKNGKCITSIMFVHNQPKRSIKDIKPNSHQRAHIHPRVREDEHEHRKPYPEVKQHALAVRAEVRDGDVRQPKDAHPEQDGCDQDFEAHVGGHVVCLWIVRICMHTKLFKTSIKQNNATKTKSI